MDILGKSATSTDVGGKLRFLREERGISMRMLAKRSGLSANALSMIERGLTSPSVSTLNKLSAALEVPITAFFQQEPERKKVVFRKASERPRVPFMRGLWEGLGGEEFFGRVEAFQITLEAGGSSGNHSLVHTGHEFVYCLRGQLEYEVDRERYILDAGDSLLFYAHLRHRWRNTGKTVVNAIILISAFDELEHPGVVHLHSIEESEEAPSEVVDEEIDSD